MGGVAEDGQVVDCPRRAGGSSGYAGSAIPSDPELANGPANLSEPEHVSVKEAECGNLCARCDQLLRLRRQWLAVVAIVTAVVVYGASGVTKRTSCGPDRVCCMDR